MGIYAAGAFDYGFQSARGDSNVALQNAMAAVGGSLSIIGLNLSQLPADDWMENIRKKIPLVTRQYLELSTLSMAKLTVLEQEAENQWELQRAFEKYRLGNLGDTILSDQDMEEFVRELHLKLWDKRYLIWKEDPTDDAMDMADPETVIRKVMDYTYTEPESLGMHVIGTDLVEVAGLIDKEQRWIGVSKKFPEEIRNFTTAHELGHALLHKQTVLHRDRPLDGSSQIPKDALEKQADKFAACFLMPRKQMLKFFYSFFEVRQLHINESSILALGAGDIYSFRARCRDRQGFANIIAQTERYGGNSFECLANLFGVSAGTMAIRLIELDLVVF